MFAQTSSVGFTLYHTAEELRVSALLSDLCHLFICLAHKTEIEMKFGVSTRIQIDKYINPDIASIPVLKSDVGPRKTLVRRNYIFLFVSTEQNCFTFHPEDS